MVVVRLIGCFPPTPINVVVVRQHEFTTALDVGPATDGWAVILESSITFLVSSNALQSETPDENLVISPLGPAGGMAH